MVPGDLLFSQPLQHGCIFRSREDVKEVLCPEPDIRIRYHAFAPALQVDDHGLLHRRQLGDFPAFQDGSASNGYFDDISFFLTGFIGFCGQGLFQEGIVDRLPFQELRRNVGHGGPQGQGHEVAEVSGHFQDKQGTGNGRTDAGREEGYHADDDDIGRKDFIDEIQGHKHAGLHGTQKGAHHEEGQEEATRHAAAVADEGKDILRSQKDEEKPQAVVGSSQQVHQLIASAQDLGQEESQKPGHKEGKEDLHILVFKNGQTVETADVEEAVVKDNACKSGGNGDEHHQSQVLRGHGNQVHEVETGTVAKKETGHNGGGDGAGHGGQEDGAGKIPVQFFQRKHHARQGCIESSRQPGAGAAGDEVPLFHPCAAQKTGQALGRHGTDLDGWSFPAQGESGTDAQGTGQDLYPQDAEPFHFIEPQDDTFHLGNAGARGHGGIAAHAVEEGRRHDKGQGPAGQGQQVLPLHRRNEEGIVNKDAQVLCLSQEETEEADGKASQYAHKYAFYKKAEPEFMPVVQGHVGPKQLPVE